jgi:uncharacterized membrane protein
LRSLDVAAFAVNAGLYAALGYVLYYVLPLTAPGFGTVRFWPSVIIPAVFAVLFGPWVGGFGAAVGIFISDMLIHGNPILSLMAGVPSNFAMFAIIGYLSKKNTDWKISMAGCGLLAAFLVWIAYYVLAADLALFFSAIIITSYVVLAVVVALTPKWRGFEVGSTIGLLVGSSIIGAMVPIFSQFLIMPGSTQLEPLTVIGGFVYLIFTFATEIPFLIIFGPPVLAACYRAFPNLNTTKKGNNSAEQG